MKLQLCSIIFSLVSSGDRLQLAIYLYFHGVNKSLKDQNQQRTFYSFVPQCPIAFLKHLNVPHHYAG